MSKRKDHRLAPSSSAVSGSDMGGELCARSVPPVIQCAVASAVLLYVVYRIFVLDVTSDEWGGLVNMFRGNVADLIAFKYASAQDHFFQSLLSIFSLRLFPEAEVVAIRLPSLVGLLAYLYGAFRITSLIKVRYLSILGFVALCSSAFLLDYFGLARGYGLALGFQMLSIWHVVNVHIIPPGAAGYRKHFNLTLWCGCLAVLCNLALLYCFGAMCVVLLWRVFESETDGTLMNRLWRTLIAGQSVIYNALLVGVFNLPRVILMTQQGELYFGGVEGFVADTVKSLVRGILYFKYYDEKPYFIYLAYGITALLLTAMFVSLARVWRKNPEANDPLIKVTGAISAMLLLSVAISGVLHLLFNVKYVIERAATGFLVLGICQLVMFSATVKRVWRGAMVVFLTLFIVSGVANLNLNRTNEPTASQMQEFVHWVGEVRAKEGRHLIIGSDSGCNYTIWYYLEKILGLTESEQTKAGIGFVRIFNGVTIYHLELPGDKGLFDENTDYLLLKHRDRPGSYPRPLRLVRQFKNAELDLFACEGERVPQKDANPGFNGKIYPAKFNR